MTEQHGGETGLGRDAKLLWEDRERPARGPKPGLSLDRIVRVAIELADAEGLAAMSMQRLATQLEAGTMSLYRYISGKSELISLMLDTAMGPVRSMDTEDGDWRTALAHWARQQREVFRRHPWTLPLTMTDRTMGPNEATYAEVGLRAISGIDLSPATMLNTITLVNGYVRGMAQAPAEEAIHGSVSEPFISTQLLEHFGKRDQYPTLNEVLGASEQDQTHSDILEAEFEFGLHRILDGIEAFLNAQR